jgi:hypothetical protein
VVVIAGPRSGFSSNAASNFKPPAASSDFISGRSTFGRATPSHGFADIRRLRFALLSAAARAYLQVMRAGLKLAARRAAEPVEVALLHLLLHGENADSQKAM